MNEMKYNCDNCAHRPICSHKGSKSMVCHLYKNADNILGNPYKMQAQYRLKAGDKSGYALYDAMSLGWDACSKRYAKWLVSLDHVQSNLSGYRIWLNSKDYELLKEMAAKG